MPTVYQGCLTQPVSMAFTTPPPLGDDQALAIVAPSRPPDATKLQIGRERLAGLGVETRVFPTADPDRDEPASPARARGRHRGRLCGSRNRRRDGVHRRRRPDSGPATPRRGRARGEPDPFFFGYSDNDNLRLFLWNRGIVSYGLGVHPDLVCDADLHTYTERYLRRALFEESLGRIVPADEWTDDWFDFEAREPREWDDTPARRCGWGRRETPPNRSAVGCGAGRSRS